MRSVLMTVTFISIAAGVIWATYEPEDTASKPCLKTHCSCSPEKVSAAGHAREFFEFAVDSGL